MSLCIITNTIALFPPTSSNSGRFVHTMMLNSSEGGIALPGVEDFARIYDEMENEFNAILVLAASNAIVPAVENAQLAAQSHGGLAKIKVLDTLQIGPGLGILTQLAARKAAAGAGLFEVEEYIRAIIPYLFTIIYPDNTPLYREEYTQHASGHGGEQSNIQPVYSIEEGQLTPYKKIRTQRHLLETFQEFLEEFERPQQFAYFHGNNTGLHLRPLRELAGNLFPDIHFNDLNLNPTISGLLGEHTVGLTVLEMPREINI
jgi:fatty acid-binding protein DegV